MQGNAPFGTQWDGIDNDNDWSSQTTLPFFANDRSFNINQDNATTVYGGYMNIDFTNPIYNTTNSNGDPAFDWSAADGFGGHCKVKVQRQANGDLLTI